MSNEHIASYLSALRTLKDASSHTLRAYQRDLEAFFSYLETVAGEAPPLERITERWIRRYIGGLLQSGLSPVSCSRKLSAIKGFFAYLVNMQVLEVSPAESIEGPKLPKHHPEFPTEEYLCSTLDRLAEETEVEAIRDCALLEVLYGCGLRISEALTMDADDFNVSHGWLRVVGKRKKMRDVPLGETAANALQRWKMAREEWVTPVSGEALFLGKRGKRLNPRTARMMVHRRLQKAGQIYGTNPHALRHAFATHLIDYDANLLAVSEMLGHASLSTTQIYTKISTERLKEVYRKHHPRGKS